MAKFKVGDKVKILDGSKIPSYTGGWNNRHMGRHVGEVHEITDVHERWGGPHAAYELDIGGICNHCKWDERALELVTTKKIVITTDGKITTATLYDGKQKIKSAEAKCAPSDTFDFNYGASLALSRLSDDKSINEEVIEKKSQMDRFIDGKVCLEVPEGKTMDFLKECERVNLRWASGHKATQCGKHKKYFKVLCNHLTYSDERMSTEPWEIWDDTKATQKIKTKPDDGVFDIFKAMTKLVAFTELMKDGLDD